MTDCIIYKEFQQTRYDADGNPVTITYVTPVRGVPDSDPSKMADIIATLPTMPPGQTYGYSCL